LLHEHFLCIDFDVFYEMLGAVGERVWIAKTFNCDRGKNIFIGDDFTGNHNLTILDIREVYIGNHVMIGPNTLITTVGHPLSPKGRREYHALAKPVHIGNNVVVAAGAVVNKEVPDNTLVGGVPATVIKVIENDI
jgi:maltose O-acetyltransferase